MESWTQENTWNLIPQWLNDGLWSKSKWQCYRTIWITVIKELYSLLICQLNISISLNYDKRMIGSSSIASTEYLTQTVGYLKLYKI